MRTEPDLLRASTTWTQHSPMPMRSLLSSRWDKGPSWGQSGLLCCPPVPLPGWPTNLSPRWLPAQPGPVSLSIPLPLCAGGLLLWLRPRLSPVEQQPLRRLRASQLPGSADLWAPDPRLLPVPRGTGQGLIPQRTRHSDPPCAWCRGGRWPNEPRQGYTGNQTPNCPWPPLKMIP